MKVLSNWDATEGCIENQRLLSRWGNAQTSAMLRRREEHDNAMIIQQRYYNAVINDEVSTSSGGFASSSSSLMLQQHPQQQQSSSPCGLLFRDQSGGPQDRSQRQQRIVQYSSSRLRVP